MSDPRDELGGEHTLFLEAASWDEPSRVEGLEFVLVREDSAAAVILENLTVNERGFDEDAPDVDPSAVDGFRSHLHDCAAVTARP